MEEYERRPERCNMKDEQKKGNITMEGSYTVEAAILLPVLLAVVIALLQICFIFHDRTVVRGMLELTVLQVAEDDEELFAAKTTEKSVADSVSDKDADISEAVEKRLLISTITDAGIRETRTGAEVFVKLESRRIVPLYFGSGAGFVKEYSAVRKKVFSKEKTIISEVLLDTLHLLE